MGEILESPGFMINVKKSIVTPVQVIEFLGLKIEYMTIKHYLHQEKGKENYKHVLRGLKVRQIIGKKTVRGHREPNSKLASCSPSPNTYRHLQIAKNQVLKKGQDYDALPVVFLLQAFKWY